MPDRLRDCGQGSAEITILTMKHQNRRSFIKSSLLGGAGFITIPSLLPSHVWAAETKPNDRLTMGFIGMGTQSRGLLGAFLGQGTQVVAVCDVDTTRREDAKKRVDNYYAQKSGSPSSAGCTGYNDFRDLIARKDIDAVCIATPDHWHAFITLAALRAGKDVYCEKPLTHNIHEAIEVIKTVPGEGRVLQTGSMQRSSIEFRVACELVRNGVIGQVQGVECSFGPPPIPCDLGEEPMEPGLDWDRWVGPAPMRPYNSVLSPRGVHKGFPNWRNYIEFGGGMVTDWGAHHLDIAQWGLGMDASGPVQVLPPPAKRDKNGAKLVYASGITVKHVNGFGVDFVGTNGRVRVNRGKFIFERDGKTIASYRGREDQDTNLGQQVRKAHDEYLKDAKVKLYVSTNHVGDFLACVKSRQKPITNEQIGGRTAICCHLMNLAYLHYQQIDWDPEQLAFAKGSGDPKWLTRDYRSPWQV
jgi:predicted dehydrogenase